MHAFNAHTVCVLYITCTRSPSEPETQWRDDVDMRHRQSKVSGYVFAQIEFAVEPVKGNVAALDSNAEPPGDLGCEDPVEEEANDVRYVASWVVEAFPGHSDDERVHALVEQVDGAATGGKVSFVQEVRRVYVNVEVELEFARTVPRDVESSAFFATLQVPPPDVQPLNAWESQWALGSVLDALYCHGCIVLKLAEPDVQAGVEGRPLGSVAVDVDMLCSAHSRCLHSLISRFMEVGKTEVVRLYVGRKAAGDDDGEVLCRVRPIDQSLQRRTYWPESQALVDRKARDDCFEDMRVVFW